MSWCSCNDCNMEIPEGHFKGDDFDLEGVHTPTKCYLCDSKITDEYYMNISFYDRTVGVHNKCGYSVIQNKLFQRHHEGKI